MQTERDFRSELDALDETPTVRDDAAPAPGWPATGPISETRRAVEPMIDRFTIKKQIEDEEKREAARQGSSPLWQEAQNLIMAGPGAYLAGKVFGRGDGGEGALGTIGKLNDAERQQWIADEKVSAERSASFWEDLRKNYGDALKRSIGNVIDYSPQGLIAQQALKRTGVIGEDTALGDEFGGWFDRKVGENIALAKRRRLLAEEMEAGVRAGPKFGTVRSTIDDISRGFSGIIGKGVKGVAYGIESGDLIKVNPLVDGYIVDTLKKAKVISGNPSEAQKRSIYQFGQYIEHQAEQLFPADEARAEEFRKKLAEGVGSMIAFMGAGYTAVALGKGAGVATIVSGVTGGLSQAGSMTDDALKKYLKDAETEGRKLTPEEERKATQVWLMGLGIGATEAVPLASFFAGHSGRFVRGVLLQATEEGGQEWVQQVLENVVAQRYYDPERKWDDNAWEGLAIGAILGSNMQAGQAGLSKLRGEKEKPAEKPPAVKPITPEGPAPEVLPMADVSPMLDGEGDGKKPSFRKGKSADPELDRLRQILSPATVEDERPTEVRRVLGKGLEELISEGGPGDAIAKVAGVVSKKLETGKVPTFAELLAALPKDERGDPDMGRLADELDKVGVRAWNGLNDDQRRQIYEAVAPVVQAVEADPRGALEAVGDAVRTVVEAAGQPGATAYDKFRTQRAELEAAVAEAGQKLQSFPKNEVGLTPDSVKFSDEFRAAKAASDKALAQLRDFNRANAATFRDEDRRTRDEQRAQSQQPQSAPASTADLRQAFDRVLSSRTKRADWGKTIGASKEQLDALVNEALADGRLKKTKAGGIARTGKKVAGPEIEVEGNKYLIRRGGYVVASAELAPDRKSVKNVLVMPEYRKKGLATALYDRIEADLGYKLTPSSGALLGDGFAFWNKRNPSALTNDLRSRDGDVATFVQSRHPGATYRNKGDIVTVYDAKGDRIAGYLAEDIPATGQTTGQESAQPVDRTQEQAANKPATRTMDRSAEKRLEAVKNPVARQYAQALLEGDAESALAALKKDRKVTKDVLDRIVKAYSGAKAPKTKAAGYDLIERLIAERAKRSEPALPSAPPPASSADLQAREDAARSIMESPEWQRAMGAGGIDTSRAPDFNTDEWRARRVYNTPDGQIATFDAARDYLLDKSLAGVPGGVANDRKVYVLLGLPGAGKSTIAGAIRKEKRAAHIVADDAKLIIPEYDGGKNSGGVHEESSLFADAMSAKAMQTGANIIIEKLGSSDASIARVTSLYKANGYRVVLIDVSVPKAIAMERAVSRWRRTGRAVPIGVYDTLNVPAVISIIESKGLIDEAAQVQWQEPTGWELTKAGPELQNLVIPSRVRAPVQSGVGGRDSGQVPGSGVEASRPQDGVAADGGRTGDGVREGTRDVSEGEPAGDLPTDEAVGGIEGAPEGDRGTSLGDVRGDGAPDDGAEPAGRAVPGEGEAVRGDAGTDPRDGDERSRIGRIIEETEAKVEADRADRASRNYLITDDDQIGQGGPKAKVRANIDAIRIVRTLEEEKREATEDERKALVKYVGWGAFAQDIFADYKPEWAKERQALKDLLSPEEYEAARRSTQNAHYTSPDVIKGMWEALAHLGFKGGRALEPSAGVGHFIGMMPQALRNKVEWTAVELDPTTGAIAKALYSGSDVRVQGFETVNWPDGFFDLAISNVPFGNYPIRDTRYKRSYNIHDYFFIKSLDKVRPGGIVAFITSAGTLDKASGAARKAMADRATFLGAIRLPGGKKGAFAGNAGTEVTTDIIFLRRRMDGEPQGDLSWLETKEIKTKDGPAEINGYFADNPDMMLGEMRLTGSMYGVNEPVLIGSPANIDAKIADAAKAMPADAFIERRQAERIEAAPEVDSQTDGIKEGAFYDKEGKLFRKIAGVGIEQKVAAAEAAKIRSFMAIRDTVNLLLSRQSRGDKTGLDGLRESLNAEYDAFVKTNGPINKTTINEWTDKKTGKLRTTVRRPNLASFRDDPDAYKVAAIENYDEQKNTASKTAIFTADIVASYERPKISGPADALAVSLNETGTIDMPRIAAMLDMSEAAAAEALGDRVYLNPNGDVWQTADLYLGGDVVTKLEEARAAAAINPDYARNIAALEAVQPVPLTRDDIFAPMGAPWIPAADYEAFLRQLMGVPRYARIVLKLNPITKKWGFEEKPQWPGSAQAQWGTEDVAVTQIIEAALNSTPVRVFDTIRVPGEGEKRVLNPKATQEAQAKVAALREAWAGNTETGTEGWIWSDDERARRLETLYNGEFNRLVPIKSDGSHLTLPGISAAVVRNGKPVPFELRPHQKNAIWRVITQGNTLFDHTVGAGKTYTMIAAAMEQKRLGLVQRPMVAVPNHMLEQFSSAWLRAYPNAKLLVADKDSTSKDKRKEFAARVAAERWDAIIITHDAFGRIRMSDEAYQNFYREQIFELQDAIDEEVANGDRKKSPTVKQLERMKESLKAKMDALVNKERKDDGIIFEELGVDQVIVDECFPYDTPIMTDRGLLPIGEVVEKKLPVSVLSLNKFGETEWKPIVRWLPKRLIKNLVKVTHDKGSFVCTENHKIWTEHGYTEAGRLAQGTPLRWLRDHLYVEGARRTGGQDSVLLKKMSRTASAQDGAQAVRNVRDGVFVQEQRDHEQHEAAVLFQSMRVAMENGAARTYREINFEDALSNKAEMGVRPGVQSRYGGGIVGADEGPKSDEKSGDGGQSVGLSVWSNISRPRWEWSTDKTSIDAGTGAFGSYRVLHLNDASARSIPVTSNELQGGCCYSVGDVGDRSGWPDAQTEEMEVFGCQKDGRTECSRVVSVEVLKPGHPDFPADCAGANSVVYDIEVADNHNYFARGVLVSNCHLFKNLQLVTRHNRVKGLATSASQRATDLFLKIQHIEKSKPGRSAIFATGTPVSNTMAEMYTMQRYLQMGALKQFNIDKFDAWAATFGEITTDLELGTDGRSFQEVTSFSKFVNIPELVQIYSRVADTLTADMLNLPRPTLKGGAPIVVTAEPSAAEEAHMRTLIDRADAIKGGKVKPDEDNMLAIMTEGRKVATDIRLLMPDEPANPDGKIAKAVENIHRIWKDGKDPALAQIVFLDMGVPGRKRKIAEKSPIGEASPESQIESIRKALKDEAAGTDEEAGEDNEAAGREESNFFSGDFNLYDEIAGQLVARGVPRGEIAYIHDAKTDEAKAKLFGQVRSGRVRILIGSTGKMGVGTNVQSRLIAMHHIDAPWKPAEVEQRDGRIIRQGNLNKEVEVYRYVTTRSLDAFMWQTLQRKANFIAQLRAGAKGIRVAEDIDNPLPEAAAIKAAASGDPRILEHAELNKELRELEAGKRAQSRSREAARQALAETQKRIALTTSVLAKYEADSARVTDTRGDNFRVVLEIAKGKEVADRRKVADAIQAYLWTASRGQWTSSAVEHEIGTISGFNVVAETKRTSDGMAMRVLVRGEASYGEDGRWYALTEKSDLLGVVRRIENMVAEVPVLAQSAKTLVSTLEGDVARLEKQAGASLAFAKEGRLQEVKGRIAEIEGALKPAKQPEAGQEAVPTDDNSAPLAAQQSLAAIGRAYKAIEQRVKAGASVPISAEVTDAYLEASIPHLDLVPAGIKVGALSAVRPIDPETKEKASWADIVGEFRSLDGSILTVPFRLRDFPNYRAGFHRGSGAILFFGISRANLDIGITEAVMRSRIAHEAVHAVWKFLPRAVKKRLFSHAETLGVLDMQLGTLLRSTGEAVAGSPGDAKTLRSIYSKQYDREFDFDDHIQQEAVAHLRELATAGFFTDAELAPVRKDMDYLADPQALGSDIWTSQSAGMLAAVQESKDRSSLARHFGATRIEDIGPNDPHPGRVLAFHGTEFDFDRFDVGRSQALGVHFGTAEHANARADERVGVTEGGRVIPAVIDAPNVLDLPDLHTWEPLTIARAVADRVEGLASLPDLVEDKAELADDIIRDRLTQAGIDAIRYRNVTEGPGWSYIVWEPGKVISATSGNMLFALGGGTVSIDDKVKNIDAIISRIESMPKEQRRPFSDKFDVILNRGIDRVTYELVPKGKPLWKRNGSPNSVGTFQVKPSGRNEVTGVEVTNARLREEYQRQGIGTKIYDMIEADFADLGGLSPSPRTQLSPIAQSFWSKRLPQGMMFALGGFTPESDIDSSTGQSMRRDLDNLGFYSKALEAARGLKQEKGTPEQMLAQLKKAGVKDAEIEATGLATLFKEKAGSTTALESDAITLSQSGVAKVLRDGTAIELTTTRNGANTIVIEAVVAGQPDQLVSSSNFFRNDDDTWTASSSFTNQQYRRKGASSAIYDHAQSLGLVLRPETRVNKISPEARAMWDNKRGGWGSAIYASKDELAKRQGDRTASPPRRALLKQITKAEIVKHLEENRVGLRETQFDKYASHSLDPNNPTYRETVLHGEPGQTPEWRDGHFYDVPNYISHMQTSMVRHEGRDVFLIDQLQSGLGQNLRDQGGGTDEGRAIKVKKIEAELAEVRSRYDRSAHDRMRQEIFRLEKLAAASSGILRSQAKIDGARAKADDLRKEWQTIQREHADVIARLEGELYAATSGTAPGHPLVNTTDQWTQTTLRRAIRQAVEVMKDAKPDKNGVIGYIGVPLGDGVLTWNPGDRHGMNEFYNKIVPKNLRNLLTRIDPSIKPMFVEKLETPGKGLTNQGHLTPPSDAKLGFTLFPLTDSVKRSVMEDGQPMFALGGFRPDPEPAGEGSLDKVIQDLKDTLGVVPTQTLMGVTIRAEDGKEVRLNPQSNVRGQTTSATGAVGVRKSRDVAAIAHESAHYLETTLGSEILDLQTMHAAELAAINPAVSPSEQWAEWFAEYLMNPTAAAVRAPLLHSSVEDVLEANGMLDGIHDVQASYQEWKDRATPEQLSSDVVSVYAGNSFADLKPDGVMETLPAKMAQFYTAAIDSLNPLNKMVKKLLQTADRNGVTDAEGRPISLKVADNPYKLARMFAGSFATGHSWLTRGIANRGETSVAFAPLTKALEVLYGSNKGSDWQSTQGKAMYQTAGQYLISQRAIVEYGLLEKKEARIEEIDGILEQGQGAWRETSLARQKDQDVLARREDALIRSQARLSDRKRALASAESTLSNLQERIQAKKDDVTAALMARDQALAARRRRDLQILERDSRLALRNAEAMIEEVQKLDVDVGLLSAEIEQLQTRIDGHNDRMGEVEEAIAQLRREREATAKRGGSAKPTAESKEWHQDFIAKVEADPKYARIKEFADLVREFTHGLLTIRHQAGLISDEQFNLLSKRKDYYTPFQRDMTDASAEDVFFKGLGMTKKWSPFKKYDGSDRAIVNPLEVLSQQAYSVAQQIMFNDAVGALSDLGVQAGPGGASIVETMTREESAEANAATFERIRSIAMSMGIDEADANDIVSQMEMNFANQELQFIWSPATKGPIQLPTLPLYRDGERIMVRLTDPEFGAETFNALNGMGKEMSDFWINVAAKPARWLQVGVTTHPTFMPRNLFRDIWDAWIKTGAAPIFTQIEGAKQLYKNGDFLRQYSEAGGIMGGRNIAALTAKEQQTKVLDLADKSFSKASAALGGIAGGLTGTVIGGPVGTAVGAALGATLGGKFNFLPVVEAVESMTRLGVASYAYKRAKEHNPDLTDTEAMLEAAFTARDVFDWNRRGSKMLTMLRLVTFLNAQIQGMDAASRRLGGDNDRGSALAKQLGIVWRRENGVTLSADEERALGDAYKTMVRMSLYTGLLTALYLLATSGDDDDKDKKYQDIRDRTKFTHSWLPDVFGTGVRLPKAFEWAVPANMIEALADKIRGRDPRLAERLTMGVYEVLVPPGVPQVLNLAMGVGANVDIRSLNPFAAEGNREIVGDSLQRLDPEAQFDAFSSQLSIDFAKALAAVGIPRDMVPSPKKIDFILRTGGYWGQDIAKGYGILREGFGGRPREEPRVSDFPVIGGFTGVAARQSRSRDELFKLMNRSGGKLSTAANTYKDYLDQQGVPDEAARYLANLEPEERAYAILKYHGTPSAARDHPLERLIAIDGAANKLRKDMILDRLTPIRRQGRRQVRDFEEKISLNPRKQTEIHDILERLMQAEAWNTMVLMKRPGWEGRKEFAVQPILDELKASSPEVFDLYEDRLQKTRARSFDDVKQGWPQLRERILREGPGAF